MCEYVFFRAILQMAGTSCALNVFFIIHICSHWTGFIRHTVNKSSFSEQCYYVMAPHVIEMCLAANNFASLQLDDFDSVSEAGADPFRTQMATLGKRIVFVFLNAFSHLYKVVGLFIRP